MRPRTAAIMAAVLGSQAALVDVARAEDVRTREAVRGRAAIESADGVPVTFACHDPSLEIYLARGDVGPEVVPDPFVRVGVAPLTVKLAPGTYTVETSSPTSSTGHARFVVSAGTPVTIDVRPGDATVRGLGGALIGLGIVAAVLGVIAVVSISPDDQHYDRFGIGLPLILGGIAGASLGVGMSALGSTGIRVPQPPPAGAVRRPGAAWGAAISWRW